jgi:hypothetical protein
VKVRNGFVSNSSSSSFCIIGVENSMVIDELLTAEGIDPNTKDEWEKPAATGLRSLAMGYGCDSGKMLNFYGNHNNPDFAGIEAEPLLQKFAIPDACKEFQKQVKKKLGVDIPLNKISLHYGNASSE